VFKGDDEGRISANVPRTVRGRDLYLRKHRDKMAGRGVLHLYLRDSGWWQQRRVRDSAMAARFYRESIHANALAPLTYVLLAISSLPMSWLDHIARYKHHCVKIAASCRDVFKSNRRRVETPPRLQQNRPKDPAAV
jgi:hypothetical protein